VGWGAWAVGGCARVTRALAGAAERMCACGCGSLRLPLATPIGKRNPFGRARTCACCGRGTRERARARLPLFVRSAPRPVKMAIGKNKRIRRAAASWDLILRGGVRPVARSRVTATSRPSGGVAGAGGEPGGRPRGRHSPGGPAAPAQLNAVWQHGERAGRAVRLARGAAERSRRRGAPCAAVAAVADSSSSTNWHPQALQRCCSGARITAAAAPHARRGCLTRVRASAPAPRRRRVPPRPAARGRRAARRRPSTPSARRTGMRSRRRPCLRSATSARRW
jgi:hypothetical protein